MTFAGDAGAGAGVERSVMLTRLLGWGILASLAGFMVVNVLDVGWGLPTLLDFLSGSSGAAGVVPIIIYAAAFAIAALFVFRTPNRGLRTDAMAVHEFNVFLIRACFWSVLLVGIADATVSLMRVEGFFSAIFSKGLATDMGRPQFVGPFIHIPLIIVGIVLAFFTRTLGFQWLALMIVVAELIIVVSRFGFSYEQALMGDLVRYWYAALFLFASAYTLFENGHVRVDVLYAGFGQTTKGFVNAWGSILLGMSTAWVILYLGFNGKQSIINSSVTNFEVTQSGLTGMFVKYQMAAFLGIFAITMLIQFTSYFLESIADYRGEPGHREGAGTEAS